MLRRNIADKLYGLVIQRFAEELPDRELTNSEKDAIWYSIYGKLWKGETESEVEEWCKTVKLNEQTIHETSEDFVRLTNSIYQHDLENMQ